MEVGHNADASGSAMPPAPTGVAAAEERRVNAGRASSNKTVALTNASAMSYRRPSFRASAMSRQAHQLRVGEASGRKIEQGGDGLFRRSVEERVE
jgi:hypothetical protein